MSGHYRWGVLGTGMIARVFMADVARAGITFAAIGSRDIKRAEQLAAAFGVPRAHGGYASLVDDPEIDVVYVATPHPMHAEHAILALEAGKHVLVEKPFTLNREEAARVVGLAAARGLVVLEAMWTRWLPHMVRIREIVAAGVLGELRAVIADHGQALPGDPSSRWQDPRLGGGALLDLGAYPVSFAHDILGVPDRVSAISTPTPSGVDRQTAILLGFPGGRQAVLHTLLDGQGPCRAAIIGAAGRIEIDPIWYAATGFSVFAADGGVIERFENRVAGRGMAYQAHAFERLIASGALAGAELPPSQSVAVMTTLDEVRRQIGLRYPQEA